MDVTLARWEDAGTRYALVGDGETATLQTNPDPDPPNDSDTLQDAAELHVSGPIRMGCGPLELRLATVGGRIAAASVTAGFAHRGVLELLRGKPPRDAARIAARIAGEATVAHATAFARAAEAASGTPAPPRAEVWRDFLGGLERLCGDLAALGAIADLAGPPALRTRLARFAERAAQVMAEATGSRLGIDVVVPGGLALTPKISVDGLIRLAADLESPEWPSQFAALHRALAGRAPVAAALAHRQGADGVIAGGGDAAHRAERLVIRCAAEARDLARGVAALAADDTGPLDVALPAATGDALGRARGPHGTVWHWQRLDAGLIEAAFVADPATRHLALLAAALAGQPVDDAALMLASLPLSVAGADL